MIRESVKESFRDPASASVVPREISAASGVFLSEIIYKSNNFESFCRGMFCSMFADVHVSLCCASHVCNYTDRNAMYVTCNVCFDYSTTVWRALK